jgi:Leucine Rich repeat
VEEKRVEKLKRRRYSLRLWMLFALIAAVSLPMAMWVNRGRYQQKVANELRLARYDFTYDHQVDSQGVRRSDLDTHPSAPSWLRRVFGDEYFEDVDNVMLLRTLSPEKSGLLWQRDHVIIPHVAGLPNLKHLSIAMATDDSLKPFRSYENLEYLFLIRPRLTSEGVELLGSLPRIEDFQLVDAGAPDGGMAPLTTQSCGTIASWPRLESLMIVNISVTDEGIEALARSRSLTHIQMHEDAQRNQITDRSMLALSRMKQLTHLHISASITDAGLARISELKNLRRLGIARSHITDEGLKALRLLPALSSLEIESDLLTDEAFEQLEYFEKLKNLGLEGTHLTTEAKHRLREKRPMLKIE